MILKEEEEEEEEEEEDSITGLGKQTVSARVEAERIRAEVDALPENRNLESAFRDRVHS